MSNLLNHVDAMSERESPPGQRLNEDALHVDIVTEPGNDIAKSELLERITVGVAGRQHFQKIYVQKSGGGNKTYEPGDDAPPADRALCILPTNEEIESRAETLEFLVVGIVLAEDPKKYSTKASGTSRNKQWDAEVAARGVLPAERNILRAIVPTTDFIRGESIKDMGWNREDIAVNERRRQLGAACKLHAARDKKPPQRALVQVSTGSETPSNSISITPTINVANVLLMQYSVCAMSKQLPALVALKQTLENILPDLLNRPAVDGILRFYDFGNVLEEEDAVKPVKAVMVLYPAITLTLDPILVLELHAALHRTNLGGKLSYKSFVAFLYLGHDRAAAGWDPKKLDEVVKAIIYDIGLANEIQEMATTRTVSKVANGATDLTPVLSGLRVALNEIVEYFKAQATALREQHSGLNNHASIEDLMIKIGNCVDMTALKALEEEVFAIHAEQLATVNSNVNYIKQCIGLIDQALALTSE